MFEKVIEAEVEKALDKALSLRTIRPDKKLTLDDYATLLGAAEEAKNTGKKKK